MVPQEEAVVTREWLEVAVREAAMVDVVTIVKIDFEKVAKVYDTNKSQL